MGIHLLILSLFVSSLLSCVYENEEDDSGIIAVKIQQFDTAGKSIFSFSYRIWYRDSLVIEEVKKIISKDSAGKNTTEVVADHYTFIDLRANSIYEYRSFADSASVNLKYSGKDSITVHGGWDFYKGMADESIGPAEILTDTVVDQINYKRVKLNCQNQMNKKLYYSIGYLQCDKRGSMFSIEKSKSYTNAPGCPMVKVYSFSIDNKYPPVSLEVDFLSDTLTKGELKVFDAWQNNAKKNPVNR